MEATDFFRKCAASGDPTGKRLLDLLRAAPDRTPDIGDEPPEDAS